MFKILLIALICYMCFVVYKTKRDMLIEEKKKKQDQKQWNDLFIGVREKTGLLAGTRTCYCSNERNHLRKGCSKYIRFSCCICSNECRWRRKALEQDKEVAKEVEYVEEFEHTPASEAVYEIPFQAMRKYQRKYLNMRRHFWTRTVANPSRNRTESTFPQAVSEVEDMNVVRWTVKVIGRNKDWHVYWRYRITSAIGFIQKEKSYRKINNCI